MVLFVVMETIWFQPNKMFFLAVVVSVVTTITAAPCAGKPHVSYTRLQLGLPANYNGFVSGYLPEMTTSKWFCQYGQHTWSNVHGLFSVYTSTRRDFVLTASAATADEAINGWSLYFAVSPIANSNSDAAFRVCKFGSHKAVTFNLNTQAECIINERFNMHVPDGQSYIFGVTWSGTTVRLYLPKRNYAFSVENNWSRATAFCEHANACAMQEVRDLVTYNVTTGADGGITSYDLCRSCNGFPQHVFSLPADGALPLDFSFDNWFLLTNSSSLIEGRVVSNQPLRLNCLWPIPQLLSTGTVIYFNGTAKDVMCNGYNRSGEADALRFSLNFTDSRPFGGEGSVVLVIGSFHVGFSCTNDTKVIGRGFIPFGRSDVPYYCFVSVNGSSTFVGMLPPILKEIVVTKTGAIYINGYRVFQLGNIDGVIFNVTSTNGADLWTVAFAVNEDVLVEVNATNIQRVLYCDSPVNRLKCQQMQFELQDGFYPAAGLSRAIQKKVFVELPRAYTHSYVQLYVSYNNSGGSTTGPPTSQTVKFVSYNGSVMTDLPDMVCVGTTQFTTNLTYVAQPTPPSWVNTQIDDLSFKLKILAGNCPFNFDSLNHHLSFESICFSTEPQAGSCALQIVKVWAYSELPFASLYVTFKRGNKVLGVPEPRVGVFDISEVYEDECCEYTIYGITGRGIITKTNVTYFSGLYYRSSSGMLLGFKNATTGDVYAVTPCDLSKQVVVYTNRIIGAMTASLNDTFDFNHTITTEMFFYHSDSARNCTNPVLTYSSIGVCADGSIGKVNPRDVQAVPASPLVTGNLTVPINFTMSVQVEYVQIAMQPVSVDCAMYVCNGNPHCQRLLTQYASACQTIEDALRLSARLESMELTNMLTISDHALELATIGKMGGDYNLSSVLPASVGGRSAIEDLLFDKVVTNGLGTVDQDYKKCVANFKDAQTFKIMTHTCAQYYNGIMVVPGVADSATMGHFTASLVGAMSLAGLTAAAAYPFGQVVQGRLNYVALQTDVLQQNQQQLANSFNAAMGNITAAFKEVNSAIQNTHEAIRTVATALNKVETVVNQQGQALAYLSQQLSVNFEAISSSIEDIYNRLEALEADVQVDRLITGRLAALNAFVTQQLTRYTELKASRQLAQEKVNECVKSQSKRYGFCGNGTHVFSLVNAAPDGLLFFHTVLVPTAFAVVDAWAGMCVEGRGFVLRDVSNAIFQKDGKFYITSRDMYEPRIPTTADFVEISGCSVSYVNVSSDSISSVIPDYIDVNQTVADMLEKLNLTRPPLDLNLDVFNATYLNLSQQIAELENRSALMQQSTERLDQLIQNINNTLVDLEWLSRIETYVKWPWYIWLAIALAFLLAFALLFWCCMSTGCCGCCSCMSSLDLRGHRLQQYEVEKVHIQ
ncbi:spike protein [alphacoronavirus sp. WA3607]|uniref:Spike protein n=1 Tax=alphacoronavirus sp. WA3607 TaxID=3070155 RepID=A0AA48UFJ8_9ALPC|nr:spike protein [Alphacoronavirus sp.]QGX41951.1 spike protein [alphacoronavirus sp. WA3607]